MTKGHSQFNPCSIILTIPLPFNGLLSSWAKQNQPAVRHPVETSDRGKNKRASVQRTLAVAEEPRRSGAKSKARAARVKVAGRRRCVPQRREKPPGISGGEAQGRETEKRKGGCAAFCGRTTAGNNITRRELFPQSIGCERVNLRRRANTLPGVPGLNRHIDQASVTKKWNNLLKVIIDF